MGRLTSLVSLVLCLSAWAPKAHADDLQSTCQQLIEQRSKLTAEAPSPFKLALKLFFDRSALINTHEVEHLDSLTAASSKDSELTLFTLGEPAPFTAEDKTTLKKISLLQKQTEYYAAEAIQ